MLGHILLANRFSHKILQPITLLSIIEQCVTVICTESSSSNIIKNQFAIQDFCVYVFNKQEMILSTIPRYKLGLGVCFILVEYLVAFKISGGHYFVYKGEHFTSTPGIFSQISE
jgi:hypothetical protein